MPGASVTRCAERAASAANSWRRWSVRSDSAWAARLAQAAHSVGGVEFTRRDGGNSPLQAVEKEALGAVAGTARVGELHPAPCRGRRRCIELLRVRALDAHHRTGGRVFRVARLRAEGALAVESRG